MMPYVFSWTFLLISLFVATIVFAQQKRLTPEERADQISARWKSTLSLSDDQAAQIRSILLERERQWDEDHAKLQSATPAERSALRTQQREHRQAYRDRLHRVLTPEQLKTARKQLPEMRRMHRPGAGMKQRRMKQGIGPAYGRP